jgi:hypothetical protein
MPNSEVKRLGGDNTRMGKIAAAAFFGGKNHAVNLSAKENDTFVEKSR